MQANVCRLNDYFFGRYINRNKLYPQKCRTKLPTRKQPHGVPFQNKYNVSCIIISMKKLSLFQQKQATNLRALLNFSQLLLAKNLISLIVMQEHPSHFWEAHALMRSTASHLECEKPASVAIMVLLQSKHLELQTASLFTSVHSYASSRNTVRISLVCMDHFYLHFGKTPRLPFCLGFCRNAVVALESVALHLTQ